jgi:tRNA (cmo5U34)-methyltransferase
VGAARREGSGQFHWDPETYLEVIRAEVPDYDELEDALVRATVGIDARRILDLGTGSGETARRVLAVHPKACLTGIDESPDMLAGARAVLPEGTELLAAKIEDPLPEGLFDLVVSALAVHHLVDRAKADLFGRIRSVLSPNGRFVLADVIIAGSGLPVTPIEPGVDLPSSVADQLVWLQDAGFSPRVVWARRDLVVVAADVR